MSVIMGPSQQVHPVDVVVSIFAFLKSCSALVMVA